MFTQKGSFIMKKSRTFRKSFVAAIAALCLAAPLAVMPVQVETSYAAEATYSAYQIFKGTLANNSLGNIEWGADVSLTTEEETALLEALKNESNYFAGCTTAKSIAEVLSTGNTEADKVNVIKTGGDIGNQAKEFKFTYPAA